KVKDDWAYNGHRWFVVTLGQSLRLDAILDEIRHASDSVVYVEGDGIGIGGAPNDIAHDRSGKPDRYGFSRGKPGSDTEATTYEFTLETNGTVSRHQYEGYPPYGFAP